MAKHTTYKRTHAAKHETLLRRQQRRLSGKAELSRSGR